MWKFKATFLVVMTFASLFAVPGSLFAREQNPSPVMIYLGMGREENIEISDFLLATAEKQLRKDVQMRPYEVMDLLDSGSVEIDDLMSQLALLQQDDKNKVQQKTSVINGPPPNTIEKKIPVWADKLQKIKASNLAYSLHLTKYRVDMEPGGLKATVSMAAGIEIYKLDFPEAGPPSYELVISALKTVPANATGTLREIGSLEQQLVPLVRKASDKVGKHLAKRLRKLQLFQAQSTVKGGSEDMLVIPMGKNLGVELDDAFNIMRKDESGKLKQVAWAKARKITKDSSQAEVILSDSDWSFSGDEIAIEDENSGVGLQVSAIMEVTGGDLLDHAGAGVYPGGELTLWTNLASSVDISEMYLLVSLDFMSLGRSIDPSVGVLLGHATIGLAKKWTFHRLALWAGLRAGFAYFLYSESSLQTQQDQDAAAAHLGFGGDALLGMEFRLIENLSLFAQLTGRIFSNPIDWLKSSHMETGGQASAGLLVDF